MIFTSSDLQQFRDASGDRNPLHLDSEYAKRTPYGRVVVYGVAVVLRAISEWSRGRAVNLASVRARFHRPIYLDEVLACDVDCRGAIVELRVRRGATVCASIKLEATLTDEVGDLAAWQQEVLFWASRFVGMEVPGRQALFSSLKFEFEAAGMPGAFRPIELIVEENEHVHLVSSRGCGAGVVRFQLEAFRRPLPVEVQRDQVEASVGRSRRYAGRAALVAGSGRGFGHALKIALELHGAEVTGVARCDADLTSERDCDRLLDVHRASHGRIDLLVLNASPPIEPRTFGEQTAAWLDQFLTTSVRACAVMLRAALPAIPAGGQIVLISSSWLTGPPARFSHYIAAKAALEGLVHGTSIEWPDRAFAVARLPRMLTDQTNVVFDPAPPEPTPSVVARVMAELAVETGPGFRIFDVSERAP